VATLRLLTGDELRGFADSQTAAYIEERVASGEDRGEASSAAMEQARVLFPDGRPADGHVVFRIFDDDGAPVGAVWIGPHPTGHEDKLWVWDIELEDAHRGRGLGRAAMLLVEEEARSRGATELGLNVFAHNTVARALYESIGYEPVATRMRKRL
jgi:ribosomal protein S18 acetylase RimI-like enzyme